VKSLKKNYFSTQKAFDKLRTTQPKVLEKIKLISGDVAHKGLGLSLIDRDFLINEVDIIFHNAASVNFFVSLYENSKVNVEGTFRLLELAKEMKRLKVFSFMSTAFSQCYQNTLEEKHYSTGLNLDRLLAALSKDDVRTFDLLEAE
jgi:alcohol-forming fatty acyl-CoA reductase